MCTSFLWSGGLYFSEQQYNEGERAIIPEYPIPDAGNVALYKNIILICILIVIIAAIIYAVLYEYIIEKRKNTLNIFRICGFTIRKAKHIYLVECMSVAIGWYAVAFLLYQYIALPYLDKVYYYIREAYSVKVYIGLSVAYVVIIYIILRIMLAIHLKKNIKMGYQG